MLSAHWEMLAKSFGTKVPQDHFIFANPAIASDGGAQLVFSANFPEVLRSLRLKSFDSPE
jgi:hypothetical protein